MLLVGHWKGTSVQQYLQFSVRWVTLRGSLMKVETEAESETDVPVCVF